ncbi:MAG: Xaa-Pro peptidase family protein [Proteobacteria bacterium]|nr:Xaa-Pro peptidase family protein [Pseudomonadota bacterium]
MIPSFTPIDFQARRQRLAQSVKAAGFDAYVGTRQAGLHYLSGAFMPWRGAVIVTANGDCRFIYWAWDASRVKIEAPHADISTFTFSDFTPSVAALLDKMGLAKGRIGIDLTHPGAAQIAPGMLSASEYLELKEALPQARIDNGVDLLDEVILRKGPEEIERLRHAAHVADIGFHAGREVVRGGVTENSVAGTIEKAIRDAGSTWSWAITGGTEVGSGHRTGYLHGVTQQATDKPIGDNEFVILDLHPMIDLYLSDASIPVFIGKPSAKQRGLIDCWEEVAATMVEHMRPGDSIPNVVKKGLAVFDKHGLTDYCLPTFGHGLGTCARTRPFINLRSKDVVQAGMVVALGTHLYMPEVGGMRLEFPLLVTEGAAEPLMKTPPKVHFV